MFISFFLDIAKSHSNDQILFFMKCFVFSFVVKHELSLSFPFLPLPVSSQGGSSSSEDSQTLSPCSTQLLQRPICPYTASLFCLIYKKITKTTENSGAFEDSGRIFKTFYFFILCFQNILMYFMYWMDYTRVPL